MEVSSGGYFIAEQRWIELYNNLRASQSACAKSTIHFSGKYILMLIIIVNSLSF